MSDESSEFDLGRMIGVLERHRVRYVLIGGVSGTFHGMVEYQTKDVGVLVQDSRENLSSLAAALIELGARPVRIAERGPIDAADLGVANTQWDTDAGALDVLVSVAWPRDATVVYADIHRNADRVDVDGFVVSAASLDDLIAMKEAADRYKDHLALPELRRLRGDRYPERNTGNDPFGEFNIEDGADD